MTPAVRSASLPSVSQVANNPSPATAEFGSPSVLRVINDRGHLQKGNTTRKQSTLQMTLSHVAATPLPPPSPRNDGGANGEDDSATSFLAASQKGTHLPQHRQRRQRRTQAVPSYTTSLSTVDLAPLSANFHDMPRNQHPAASTLRNRITNKIRLKIHQGSLDADAVLIPDEKKSSTVSRISSPVVTLRTASCSPLKTSPALSTAAASISPPPASSMVGWISSPNPTSYLRILASTSPPRRLR
ncbi:hypothetical protein GALMADRAFT_155425 [Galerina marginata CBS 339.88]|uniref:Uncharacterized protein n=1 Tax=Galerina marginata (strain CBS 339.88) TaxID=685588 RepID=A0A067T5F0_GALM3|nr:hypothetical protein GALMADRAFT_155425 [Galerina marginata CBS 339.88]